MYQSLKISILIFFQFILFLSYSQVNNTFGEEEEEQTEKEYFFSIRLMPDFSSGLIQCAIIKGDVSNPEEVSYLTPNSWILQAAGYELSDANPEKENLIHKYNVFDIPDDVIKIGDKEILFYTTKKTEAILQNLWRLKYSEFPYHNPEKNSDKGWAKHPDLNITWLPSEAQMQILKTYGIENFGNFITEENTFKLLRDVRDKDWQNRYIQSAGVYYQNPEDSISNQP